MCVCVRRLPVCACAPNTQATPMHAHTHTHAHRAASAKSYRSFRCAVAAPTVQDMIHTSTMYTMYRARLVYYVHTI